MWKWSQLTNHRRTFLRDQTFFGFDTPVCTTSNANSAYPEDFQCVFTFIDPDFSIQLFRSLCIFICEFSDDSNFFFTIASFRLFFFFFSLFSAGAIVNVPIFLYFHVLLYHRSRRDERRVDYPLPFRCAISTKSVTLKGIIKISKILATLLWLERFSRISKSNKTTDIHH